MEEKIEVGKKGPRKNSPKKGRRWSIRMSFGSRR